MDVEESTLRVYYEIAISKRACVYLVKFPDYVLHAVRSMNLKTFCRYLESFTDIENNYQQ